MPEEREWMRTALHDLCQPLTALECRLFLGTLDGSEAEMRTSIDEARVQCERVMVRVREMQVRLE